ncbi:MAG: hypothetical protein ACRYG8_03455 [Janthinobacterium lividum]
MSGTKTTNGFSIGKDLSLVLVGPTGAIHLPKITDFDDEPIYETVKSKVLDGPTRQVSLPDGHNLTIKFDREDGAVDSLFSGLEAAYWAVGGYMPHFSLYEYVTERNGSQSTYEFVEVDLQYKPGSWKAGAPVAGELKGYARFKRSL